MEATVEHTLFSRSFPQLQKKKTLKKKAPTFHVFFFGLYKKDSYISNSSDKTRRQPRHSLSRLYKACLSR